MTDLFFTHIREAIELLRHVPPKTSNHRASAPFAFLPRGPRTITNMEYAGSVSINGETVAFYRESTK